MADLSIDAGREHCGQLLDLIKNTLSNLRPGQTLAATTYDPSMELEVAGWCWKHGHRLIKATPNEQGVELLIQKAGQL